MDIIDIVSNIMAYLLYVLMGSFFIICFSGFLQEWVNQFYPYKIKAKINEHYDMVERYYHDSYTVNYEAKSFFSRHYLKADTKRQYYKYAQADNENIYIYDILFCKTITLPFFALSSFFNAYIISQNVIISLQSGVPFSFFADDFNTLCSYVFTNLCLGFGMVYARQLYANFITRGLRLSNVLPGLLCTSNIIFLFMCNSYLNSYHPYYIFIIVIQTVLAFLHLAKPSYHYSHLFMDEI